MNIFCGATKAEYGQVPHWSKGLFLQPRYVEEDMVSIPHVHTPNGKSRQFVHMSLFGIITLSFFCLIPRMVTGVVIMGDVVEN